MAPPLPAPKRRGPAGSHLTPWPQIPLQSQLEAGNGQQIRPHSPGQHVRDGQPADPAAPGELGHRPAMFLQPCGESQGQRLGDLGPVMVSQDGSGPGTGLHVSAGAHEPAVSSGHTPQSHPSGSPGSRSIPQQPAWYSNGTPPGVFVWRLLMERRIARYRPTYAPPAWERVEHEVRATVARAAPLTTHRARDLLTALTRIAVFADQHGHPPDARRWLDPAMVEYFTAVGCPEVREAARANYRSCLTAIRQAVYGPDLPGGKPVSLSSSDPSAPYTSTEKAGLWAWAGGQPTQELRRGLRLLLVLGLGCGLCQWP